MLTMKAKAPKRGEIAKRVLAQFEQAEIEALTAVEPVIQSVLIATVGTQYHSLLDLRRMGYPYSADRPKPPMAPGIINKQSGRFFDSLLVTTPTRVGKQIVMSVYLMDQERVDQLTRGGRSIPRPYKQMLQARMRRQVDKALGDAFASLVKVRVKG